MGRLVAFGYRSDEVGLGPTPKCSSDVVIQMTNLPHRKERPPVAVTTGPFLVGCLPPHPDNNCSKTLADGVRKRMGQIMPPNEMGDCLYTAMRRTTKLWLEERGISPFSCNVDWTFETWLAKTQYPEWRKEELRKYESEIDMMLKRNKWGDLMNFTVKLFMKDEHYVDYKHARGIYARDDAAKIFFGPWARMIEEVIYEQPEFIKHVPVANRPEYIYDRLHAEGNVYVATDYSSFEAHFSEKIQANCEFVLYEHLLSQVPNGGEILDIMKEVLTGQNRVFNKFLKAKIKAKRMSGEMFTSLGNGFSNLMWMTMINNELGLKTTGVVEGDDGLFSYRAGTAPSSSEFTKRGFIIKLVTYSQISKAGFCGQLFDEDDRKVVTDPYKIVALFGWTKNRYLRSNEKTMKLLLRCKSLSMMAQYPGCPIIAAMAEYGLRVTRSYDVADFIERRRDLDSWHLERLRRFAKESPRVRSACSIGTRLLFEELYGISIEQQIRIETYFDSLSEITPLSIPELSENCPESWRDYYSRFTAPLGPVIDNCESILYDVQKDRK